MQQVAQSAYAKALYDNKVVVVNNGVQQATPDGQVSSAVMQSVLQLIAAPINKPAGNDIDAVNVTSKASTTPADVQNYFNSKAASSTAVVLLGESHTDPTDHTRAGNYITAMSANPATLTPNLVVFERGMAYNNPGTIPFVREDNLTTTTSCPLPGGNFGMGLSKAQRSMIVAGYLVLCAASGNLNDTNRFLLFYGSNHNDILTYFDYFARHSGAEYLAKQPRFFNTISSNV